MQLNISETFQLLGLNDSSSDKYLDILVRLMGLMGRLLIPRLPVMSW
jgi:hypothetical protein